MARTPLFRTLTRALRQNRSAARVGMGALEYAEQESEHRVLTRRRFLTMSAAACTLPLLPACGDGEPQTSTESSRVVIAGAGIAGLHCAYRLKRLGVNATVYDAGKRIGGRMFTDRQTFPEGMHSELGGELIDTGHPTMRDLARELHIDLLDYTQDDPTLDTRVAYIGGTRLTMQDILTGFTPIAAKIDAALATLTDPNDVFVYYNKHNGGEALDALSISAWLDSIGAGGPVRTLLEVAYTTEYGLEPDVSNVLNMMLLISTDTQQFELFGDSDERFHAREGNDLFPTRLAEALDPAQIELDSALAALREASDGRYVLTFQRGASTFEVTAGYVVLALPFSILRTLDIGLDLPPAKKAAIAELGYGTNAKLMCGFSSRLWREKHHSNGETFTDNAFQSTWETSRLQPGKSGIITNFTGGRRGLALGAGTKEARMAEFLDQFDGVFPGVAATSNNKVARFHWPTYPLTRGSYSAYKVGQYTKFAGAEFGAFKNVHFAGEHTSLDAQGYMEGGALTGAMAAAEVAAALGMAMQRPTSAFERARAVWTPEQRIWTRARAACEHRRWHAAVARWRKAV